MEIKILEISTVTFFCFLIASCNSNNCDLGVASDQFRHADTMEYKNVTYYFYTRTTGWNDKAVYFQLYDQNPQFDTCGKPNIKPIYFVVYDDYPEIKYIKAMVLEPNQPEKLNITYTTDKNEGIENVYDVTFTR